MNINESLIIIRYCLEGLREVIPIELLLYSHIPTAFAAFCFGFFVFLRQKNKASSSLLFVCIGFSIWCFLDLSTWFSFLGAGHTLFTWSLIDLVGVLFFFFAYRFLYTFIYNTEIPTRQMAALIALMLPVFITTLLGLNIQNYNTLLCEAQEHEWVVLYAYFVQLVFLIATLILGIYGIKTQPKKQQNLFAFLGISLFLFFFFSATFIVAILVSYTAFESAYNFTIYGLFGMPILLMFLGYLIVKYQAFNIKMVAAQAIIVSVLLIDAAQVFFSSSVTELIINIITLILVIIFGYFLVRSVKQEIVARERNEELAKDLARANARLRELDKQKSEFVSIASHQLRSPLTSIRGHASMLLEGSYGKLTQKAEDVIRKIEESSSYMALSIEDFLNVSRIEQGRMKYECANIHLIDMVEKVTDELRPVALRKGLIIYFKSKCRSHGIVNVDPGKMRQVLFNIMDNAIKYTEKGSITVTVSDVLKTGQISVTVTDTGVGMSEEALLNVFDKFVRAKNANSINTTGTGLGLYVAKQMLVSMHGTVEVSSPGEGLGSTFTILLPLAKT